MYISTNYKILTLHQQKEQAHDSHSENFRLGNQVIITLLMQKTGLVMITIPDCMCTEKNKAKLHYGKLNHHHPACADNRLSQITL